MKIKIGSLIKTTYRDMAGEVGIVLQSKSTLTLVYWIEYIDGEINPFWEEDRYFEDGSYKVIWEPK